MSKRYGILCFIVISLLAAATASASNRADEEPSLPDAQSIVQAAFDYWRGRASKGVFEMIIHRPDWQRSQVLTGWTRGEEDSVFLIIEPTRDAGNGTLKRGNQMWTFNPKINRVIKLPPSMLGQAWMGSDFTNNDLLKSDSIVRDFTHRLLSVEQANGHKIYVIESIPKPGAPVVWGKEILKVRDDHIFLEEAFFDQDYRLVKSMIADEIGELGGKVFPRISTMQQADEPERYTRLIYRELEFFETLPERYFTQAFLRNPRE